MSNEAVSSVESYPVKEQPKMTLQEYCQKHRCWAAKDDEWDEFEERPDYIVASNLGRRIWFSNGMCNPLDQENLVFPDVTPEKSLIAPDGRLILMEPKKPKRQKVTHFKVGHWYQKLTKAGCDQVLGGKPLKCIRVTKVMCPPRSDIVFVADLLYGENVIEALDYDGFVEVPSPALRKPKKYDLVFAWRNTTDIRIPPEVRTYWGHLVISGYGMKNVVFPNKYISLTKLSRKREQNLMIVDGWFYDHVYPFEPSLVGVPIKDLPKEESNE